MNIVAIVLLALLVAIIGIIGGIALYYYVQKRRRVNRIVRIGKKIKVVANIIDDSKKYCCEINESTNKFGNKLSKRIGELKK